MSRPNRRRSATPAKRAPAPTTPLFAAAIPLLGTAPDPVIAKRFGVTAYRIKAERRSRGIEPYRGSGFDPELGPGQARSVIKTVRLSTAEEQAQLAAVQRAGAKDWGTWIRDLGNAAAVRPQAELLAAMQAAGVSAIEYETASGDPPPDPPGVICACGYSPGVCSLPDCPRGRRVA